MTKFPAILCALLCLQFSVKAWNAEGHMVVAQIAYNHLNPVAKAKCNALIASNTLYSADNSSNFVTAACWADDIKSYTSAYSIWHYIDIPFSLDGTSTNGVEAASFDVVRAIRTNILVLQNPASTLSNQAVSLRFLLHFAGDIQQPLHCSTAVSAIRPSGDGGGNSFYATNSTWSNLHSMWDAGGGYIYDYVPRPLDTSGQNILNAKVAQIEADYPYNYSTNLGTIPDSAVWAREGWNLARTNCYVGVTNLTHVTSAYLANVMAVTKQRMAAGGHRLADLLNTLFPALPIVLNSSKVTNGQFSFSWTTITNGTYRVQWKQQLTDATWTDLANITASSNSAAFTENLTQTQKFYRIVQY